MLTKTKQLLGAVALAIGMSCAVQASVIELANIDSENQFSIIIAGERLDSTDSTLAFNPPGRFTEGVGDFAHLSNASDGISAFTMGPLDLYSPSSADFGLFFNVNIFGFTPTPASVITGLTLNTTDVLFDPNALTVSFTGNAVLTNSTSQVTNLVFNGFFENIEQQTNGVVLTLAFGQFDIGYLADVINVDPTDVNAPATLGLMLLAILAMIRRKASV